MTATAIVFSCILFLGSLLLLWYCLPASSAASFLGMLIMSFAKNSEGYPLLPINSNIVFGWLCLTIVVILATLLQPAPVRYAKKGMGYITAGALVGLAIGLLGFTMSPWQNLLYAIMIIGVAAGTFFGYLIYTNTPAGKGARLNSGNFFKYFLAKGFPTAITIMQGGVVLVLIIMMHISR